MLRLIKLVPKLLKGISDPLPVIDLLQDVMLLPKAVEGSTERPSLSAAVGCREDEETSMKRPARFADPHSKFETKAVPVRLNAIECCLLLFRPVRGYGALIIPSRTVRRRWTSSAQCAEISAMVRAMEQRLDDVHGAQIGIPQPRALFAMPADEKTQIVDRLLVHFLSLTIERQILHKSTVCSHSGGFLAIHPELPPLRNRTGRCSPTVFLMGFGITATRNFCSPPSPSAKEKTRGSGVMTCRANCTLLMKPNWPLVARRRPLASSHKIARRNLRRPPSATRCSAPR